GIVTGALNGYGRETLEDGLTRMQKNGIAPIVRTVDGKPVARRLWVGLEHREEAVEHPPLARPDEEGTIEIADKVDANDRRGVLEIPADVPRQKAAHLLDGHGLAKLGQVDADVAALAVEGRLAGLDGLDLLRRARAGEFERLLVRLVIRLDGPLDVLGDGHTLEDAADHIEHLVRTELLADFLQLVQQSLDDPSFSRLARNEVDDGNAVSLLAIAVNPPHALFQPRRVPGHVVVDQDPAELQVDALDRKSTRLNSS